MQPTSDPLANSIPGNKPDFSVIPILDPTAPGVKPAMAKKKKILLIAGLLILIFSITVILIYPGNQSTEQANPGGTQVTSYSQKLGELARNIIPQEEAAASSAPTATPAPAPESTTFDAIVTSGGYREKEVNFTSNDGAKLENDNLKVKIPGLQSRFFVGSVRAADLQSLYPIYLQNPTTAKLDVMAKALGLQAKAVQPEPDRGMRVEYTDPEAKLVYDPRGSSQYEAKPGEGNPPAFAEAKSIADAKLAEMGIALEGLVSSAVTSSISSIYENFASVHPSVAVNYLRKKDGMPVVFSDTDHFTNSPDVSSLSPEITVLVTGSGKIARISFAGYGQELADNPVRMNSRDLAMAVEELKIYGGHIRNIVELEGQRTYFACAGNKCAVHDATITKATLGYYWNNSLPALSYTEISDSNPRTFEYLVPVWIFEGTGLMDKSKTDESGKLLPNPDRTDNEQFYTQPVRFTSTVPAFTQTNGVDLLNVRNYDLRVEANNQAKLTFDTLYRFPTMTGASFASAEPRNGIKYRLLILYPDQTYAVINGYKTEVYSGEVTFDLGSSKGTITTYLELSDFSNLIEKRTLLVE